MIVDAQLTPKTEARGAQRTALGLLVLHVMLVAALGRYYAKAAIPLGDASIYPTDLVAIVIALLSVRAMLAVPWDAITKLVAAFLAIGGLWAAATGLGSTGAGAKALSFFAYAVFYFVVRGIATTDADRWRLLRAITVASLGAALLGLWQVKTGAAVFEPGDVIQTSTGSTRYLPGEFALYGMMALIVIAVPFLERKLTSRDLAWMVPPAIMLVLAQHRSGFVALGAALLLSGVLLVGSARVLAATFKLAVIAAIALAVFIYFFGEDYLDATINRLQHVGDASDVNAAWRLLNWNEVLQGILDRPMGHGFALWDFSFAIEDPLTGSHNSYLDLAYRVGVIGLGTLIAIPIAMTRSTRAWIRTHTLPRSTLLVATCACMFALLTFASFNMVFESPYMSFLFWVLLGIASGATSPGRPTCPA